MFFEGQNHLHAFSTALGSLGGFQPQPVWFASWAQSSLFQIFVLSVLIFQGGGGLNWWYSVSIAVTFYTLAHFSKYITFGGKPPKTLAEKVEEDTKKELGVSDVQSEEYFYNY